MPRPFWMLPEGTPYKWQGGMPGSPGYVSGMGAAPSGQDFLQQIATGGYKPPSSMPSTTVSTNMPNFSNLQQMISLLMGNMPQSPLANAIGNNLGGAQSGQNTWNWQGEEPSPYGIRTPSLGWQWHYDEFRKPVPNLPIQGRRF